MSVCYQYQRKIDTLAEDVKSGISFEFDIQDLEFRYVDREDKTACREIKKFIERYEWLGKMPVWITHRFGAYANNILVGATVMSTPNNFSALLGKEFIQQEKLISRGATISFAPKNLASWITMQSIKWMVKNTDFRIFTAYADPMAGELGTIYQACNFYYLGQTFGGGFVYINKKTGMRFGSSYFNQRSVVKKASILDGIEWKREYIILNRTGSKHIINYDAIPLEVRKKMKQAVEKYKDGFERIESKPKHKYAYILSRTVGETKTLRSLFVQLNPQLPYPTERGE